MKKKIFTFSFIGFLSIILWVFVALSQEYTTTIDTKITFAELPKNYSVGESSTDQVFIRIRGKGWELAKLYLGAKEDYVIPVHRRIGKHKNEIKNFTDSNPWINSHLEVLDIAPSQIEYDVEKVNSKRVRIIQNMDVKFKNGFAATSEIRIDPEYIELYGPATTLQSVNSINTVKKEFTDISENFKEQIALEQIEGITSSSQFCSVEFEVQKIVDKNFEGITVESLNVPPSKDIIVFPAKINVIIRGGINKLGRLTSDSIKAYLNYWTALKEESGQIEPDVVVPAFTTLVTIEPKKIEYIIKQY